MIDLKLFDTIIFDFGGVIFDIDPERSKKAFIKLYGKENTDKIYTKGLLIEFEKGNLNASELLAEVENLTATKVASEVFNRAWTSMLIDYKSKRIERIQLLAKTHKLLMLSNTNETHYAYFSNKLEVEYGLKFTDLFEAVYLSNKMGLFKPDLEIYKQVLIEQNLIPERTLFIEDTRANVEAANKVGIETLLIPRNGNFYDFFE